MRWRNTLRKHVLEELHGEHPAVELVQEKAVVDEASMHESWTYFLYLNPTFHFSLLPINDTVI